MALTSAQLTTFKAAILANTDPVVVQALLDGNAGVIAAWYNGDSDFWVFKASVSTEDIAKGGIKYSEYETALGAAERSTFDLIIRNGTIDPRDENVREGLFAVCFKFNKAPETTTRLLALIRRLANHAEKLFATGLGTTASPGSAVFEGNVSVVDISQALQS